MRLFQPIPQQERTNAHRPTPGPAQIQFAWVESGRGGCRAPRDGGAGVRVTSNQ